MALRLLDRRLRTLHRSTVVALLDGGLLALDRAAVLPRRLLCWRLLAANGAAVVALEQGRSRAALGILASVETLRSKLGLGAEPLEQQMSLKTLDSARSMLDVGEAQQAWLAGSQLTADAAVEPALASLD